MTLTKAKLYLLAAALAANLLFAPEESVAVLRSG